MLKLSAPFWHRGSLLTVVLLAGVLLSVTESAVILECDGDGGEDVILLTLNSEKKLAADDNCNQLTITTTVDPTPTNFDNILVEVKLYLLTYNPEMNLNLDLTNLAAPFQAEYSFTDYADNAQDYDFASVVSHFDQLKTHCGDFSLTALVNISGIPNELKESHAIGWLHLRKECSENDQEVKLKINDPSTEQWEFPVFMDGVLHLKDLDVSVEKRSFGESTDILSPLSSENVLAFINEFPATRHQNYLQEFMNQTKWRNLTSISHELLRDNIVSYKTLNNANYLMKTYDSISEDSFSRLYTDNYTLPKKYRMVDKVNLATSKTAVVIFLLDPLQMYSAANDFGRIVAIPVTIESGFILQGKKEGKGCSVFPYTDNTGAIITQGDKKAYKFNADRSSFSKARSREVYERKMEYYEAYEISNKMQMLDICNAINATAINTTGRIMFNQPLFSMVNMLENVSSKINEMSNVHSGMKEIFSLVTKIIRPLLKLYYEEFSEMERKKVVNFIIATRQLINGCPIMGQLSKRGIHKSRSKFCRNGSRRWVKNVENLIGLVNEFGNEELVKNMKDLMNQNVSNIVDSIGSVMQFSSKDSLLRKVLRKQPKSIKGVAWSIAKILAKLEKQEGLTTDLEDARQIMEFLNSSISIFVEQISDMPNFGQWVESIHEMAEREFEALQGQPGDRISTAERCELMARSMVQSRKLARKSKSKDSNPISSLRDDEDQMKHMPLTFRTTEDGIYLGRHSELLQLTMWTHEAMCSCDMCSGQSHSPKCSHKSNKGAHPQSSTKQWNHGTKPYDEGKKGYWPTNQNGPDYGSGWNDGFNPIIPGGMDNWSGDYHESKWDKGEFRPIMSGGSSAHPWYGDHFGGEHGSGESKPIMSGGSSPRPWYGEYDTDELKPTFTGWENHGSGDSYGHNQWNNGFDHITPDDWDFPQEYDVDFLDENEKPNREIVFPYEENDTFDKEAFDESFKSFDTLGY